MKIVVAGGTGFIGKQLVSQFVAAGDGVILLTRGGKIPDNWKDKVAVKIWDGKSSGEWESVVDGADIIINLCGESIASKRWDENQKKLLSLSRLDPTRALIRAIHSAQAKPRVLVNASAVGYYGVVDGEADESTSKGKGFLPDLCEGWEQTAWAAEKMGTRVVLLRTGIVLDKESGALQKMAIPFKYFLGGPLGSGKQWFPWVHVQDAIGLILFAIKNKNVAGALNACSPQPERMVDFCRILGKVLNRPSWLPVPEIFLKALLGEMAEMILGGQRAIPRKALNLGFKFRYPSLESALVNLLRDH